MRWQRKISQIGQTVLRDLWRTGHGRIVLCGLLIGLCYLPAWLGVLFSRAGQGSASLALLLPIVYLGLRELWRQRRSLAQMSVSDEDQFLGHLLILGGVMLYPFCRFAVWPQAVVWLFILIGIACSSWGVSFFQKNLLATVLIGLSVYPKPGETAKILWQTLTPPQFLDRNMAWLGSVALRAIGQPAVVVNDVFISLPKGAVEVGWGCNGFAMASNIAIAGLILGLFLKQSWPKIVLLMAIGTTLALVFNIPRLMIVTYAAVYWGRDWFDFWHGSWGAQIFIGILFTVYYYAVMALVKQPSKSEGANSTK